tara:strand:- start:5693 stop:5860 length:168 start_codon:yes stop_codon:yes gene_type:complete
LINRCYDYIFRKFFPFEVYLSIDDIINAVVNKLKYYALMELGVTEKIILLLVLFI